LDNEPSGVSKQQRNSHDSNDRYIVPASTDRVGLDRLDRIPVVKHSRNCKKRQGATISTSASRAKKNRTTAQRTHSPRPISPAISTPSWFNRIQKINPTVSGIEEVAKHLSRGTHLRRCSNIPFSFLALPTECTYEACTLLRWIKDESMTNDDNAIREAQLDRLKIISSAPSIHVYLQHHNINQLDQFLQFPKKPYATKQNPTVRCAFNESRLLFQKLADQFWPGPVHIYLPPQSIAPDGLLRTVFLRRRYIGFRCPSHPLAVKVLKQVNQRSKDGLVLVGSPILDDGIGTLTAKDVASKLFKSPDLHAESKVEILHGEERREIFSVPTCEFQDAWLELWLVPDKRTVVLRGKSQRDVLPQLKEVLRNTNEKNRIISSVLQHWTVADHRVK